MAGAGHSQPREAELGSRVRPGTEHRPAYPVGWLANALLRPLFVQRLPLSLKVFPDTKTRTWGQPPARGQEAVSGRQTFQQDSNSEGRWGKRRGEEIAKTGQLWWRRCLRFVDRC